MLNAFFREIIAVYRKSLKAVAEICSNMLNSDVVWLKTTSLLLRKYQNNLPSHSLCSHISLTFFIILSLFIRKIMTIVIKWHIYGQVASSEHGTGPSSFWSVREGCRFLVFPAHYCCYVGSAVVIATRVRETDRMARRQQHKAQKWKNCVTECESNRERLYRLFGTLSGGKVTDYLEYSHYRNKWLAVTLLLKATD